MASGSGPAYSPSRPRGGEVTSGPFLEISNAMVQLYEEAFGRGPTRVRTMLAGADTLLVVLEDAFTPAERTLFALGEVDELRTSRLVVQEALEKRARSVVEGALGRRTVAFVTGLDPRYAMAVTAFTLESEAVTGADHDGAPTRAGSGP